MKEFSKHGIIEHLLVLPNSDGKESPREEELAKSVRKFVDEIPGGFFIYRDGGDEEILYANEAVFRLYGCADKDEFYALTNRSFKGMVHPDDLPQVEQSIKEQILDSKDNLDYVEYRIVRKDGAVRWVEDYGHIISTGQGKVFYVFISDATEKICRRINEELLQKLRQNEVLEEALKATQAADAAKNAFLSNMSHDMRTPLNAIFGYAALAKKKADDPKAVVDYLNKIELAASNMAELTVKVLEISYSESQEGNLDEEECSLSRLLSDVYSDVSSRGERKNIKVSLDCNGIEHDAVYADREKLKRILQYISYNAVKYTKSGGKVDIKVCEKENGSSDTATFVFSVSDTGIGIGKELLPRIFDPFARENNTTQSGEFGMGLGLFIVKRFTDLMGGKVGVESEVGKGTTFTVSLCFKIKADDKDSDDSCDADFSGKKILLVEDNEINREIEVEILQDLGFEVDTAENGKIAVDKVAASAPDEYSLVLMDIQMPVMDGNRAAREIRALPDPELASIPIVALSANAFESDKRASLDSGMNEHLPKPVNVDVLIKTAAKIFKDRGK